MSGRQARRRRPQNAAAGKLENRTWPVTYKWAAVGTLVMYTAVGTQTVVPAQAQEQTEAVAARIGTLPVRRFEIAAGPLGTVLEAFQRATGIQTQVPNEGIRAVSSPGVTGVLTVEQALRTLLEGTGVTYRFISESLVSLELRGPSQSIDVVDRVKPLSSAKFTEQLRDIPQSVTVIPQALIEEQSATSLRDVLRNVPGLTMAAGEGGVPAGDNLMLRGFSARNDIFVDGVRDMGPQSRDPFNMEQVEVIKGPSSAFAGRGSTGGVINLVSKSPGLNRFIGGALNFGTDATRRVALDVNAPAPFLGERSAFRMNALAHHSGVAGRDVVKNGRWGLAPTLALGLATPTRVTLSYFKLEQDNVPDYGIPWVPATNNVLVDYRDRAAPVDRDTFYGLRSRDQERVGSDMGTVRVEHDFTDTAGLRSQLRYARSTRDSITSAPRFASNDSLVMNRNGPAWLTTDNIWDNQTDFTARFSTGRIEHSLVAGVNLSRESNIRKGRTVAPAPQTNLFNPNPNDPYDGAITLNPIVGDVAANTQAIYAFDTVKLGKYWQLNGGMRWDRFDVDGLSTAGVPVDRVDRMRSVRAGVVFKPVVNGSLYASYGTSLNPSLEGLNYQPAAATLDPEKTYTTEVGAKWEFLNNRLLLTTAVFRTEKANARTPGVLPDDLPIVLQGEQRVNGIEFGATGTLTRRWTVFAGYAFLDSKILRSNTPEEAGGSLINTPKHSGNIWTTYRIRRLEVGGGLRFVDSRYGNLINTRKVGSYWTVDATASYPLTSKLDLRVNLFNINNAYYFDRLGGGHLVPGAARSAMVSTNFRF
jgi:catecholate siderophore receptor